MGKIVFVVWWAVCSLVGAEELVEHPTIQELHREAVAVRAASGISAHPVLDEDCCRIAQRWANRMARENAMYHGGGEQIIASGYSTPRGAIAAWRNSGGHWAWLGGRSELCGWGYQRADNGVCYWAGVFRGSGRATITEMSGEGTGTASTYSRFRFRGRR